MFDFAGKRGWFFLISFLMLVPGLVSLAFSPRLKPGIDFSSGSTFTVAFEKPPSAEDLRTALSDFRFPDSRVQRTSSGTFVVRTTGLEEESRATPAQPAASATPQAQSTPQVIGPAPAPATPTGSPTATPAVAGAATAPTVTPTPSATQASPAPDRSARAKLEDQLRERFGPMTDAAGATTDAQSGKPVGFQDFSSVSEAVSRDIGRNAAVAVGAATVAILLYISWAFRHVANPLRYGISAVVATGHDALLVLGAFSIFGKAFDTEINAMFITGILTVIGFSVHDTIVVFDRIRENLSTHPGIDLKTAVNASLTETLARSINTSLTVVITVVALLALGGAGIQSFLLTLLIGIVAGTYSSIAVASQFLVSWEEGDFGRIWRRATFRPARPVEAS